MAAPEEREAAAFKARVALRVGRIADMVEAVNVLAQQHLDLTDVESGLLWEAYRTRFLKNFAPLRAMSDVLDEEDAAYYYDFLLDYNDGIKAELVNACHEALAVLEEHLLPYAVHPENVVLYRSMIADNYWVLGMILDGAHDHLDKALLAYEASYKVALENLAPGHQQRLCVLLNLSAFHYDVMGNVNRAFSLANVGLAESAVIAMTKEVADIVTQLQDNVAKWTAEQEEEDPAAAQAENEEVIAQEYEDPAAAQAENEEVIEAEEGEYVPIFQAQEAEDEARHEGEAVQLPYKIPYSSSPPSPVVVRCVSPVDRTDFLGPDGWGCGTSENTEVKVIRRRQKAAQVRRGMMG